MKKLLLCISALVFMFQGTTTAQLVDVINEVAAVGPQADPFFGNPMPAGYTAYRIYARLQDPTDRLSAVFGSTTPSPIHNLHLWSSAAGNSIWNHGNGGTLGENNNCGLWGLAPAIQYDSFVTVGAASQDGDACVDCVGSQGAVFAITNPAGGFAGTFGGAGLKLNCTVTDGSFFLPNDGSCNGFGQAPDNRVLLAQVTVPTGTLEYWLNISVFDEAIGANQMIYVHTQQDAPGFVGPIAEIDGNCLGLVFPDPAECIGTPGCTDPLANNFDPAATIDDGSCEYGCCNAPAYAYLAGPCATSVCALDSFCCTNSWDSICAGEAAADPNCAYCTCAEGCTDPAACNYDAGAVLDDGSCTYPGCTDPTANNYDAAAGCDDGSCDVGCCDQIGYDTAGPGNLSGPCATSVCALDSFCCNFSWDSICAGEAAADPNCLYCSCSAGCTDPAANNYDPAATTDDGSCEYGCCSDPGYDLAGPANLTGPCATSVCALDSFCCNFSWDTICASEAAADPNCDYCNCVVPGCTDPLANNFDPAATVDDGTCEYGCCDQAGYDTAGPNNLAGPCATSVCALDSFCCNFSWDTICASEAAADPNCLYCGCGTPGCTDPAACNYDPAATNDDGSCIIPPSNDECSGAFGNGLDCAAPGYPTVPGDACTVSVCGYDSFCCTNSWDTICASEAAADPNCDFCSGGSPTTSDASFVGDNTNSCVDGPQPSCGFGPGPDVWYSFTYNGGTVTIDTDLGTLLDTRLALYDACGGAELDCNDDDPTAGDFSSVLFLGCGPGLTPLVAGTTYYVQVSGYNGALGQFTINFDFEDVHGCCDPVASNYDPCANVCDVPCEYFGCTDPAACNYNPGATTDDGSCCLDNCITLEITAGTFPSEVSWDIAGYSGGAPFSGVLCLPTGCLDFNMFDFFDDGWNGATYTFYDQLGNVIASGTNPCCAPSTDNIPVGGGNGCTDPAACNYDGSAVCDDGSCTYPGCTDVAACNYDAAAGCDDGSCTYPGCTDPAACNYNAAAGCDDGSCTYPGCTNPAACNYDATAGCDDGSCIAAGCTDPTACNYNPAAGCDDGSCTYAPCIANDVPGGAIALAVTPLGTCNPLVDDLSGASDSPESVVIGPDLWYSFTAVTSGIRIQAADDTPQDLAIELFDASLNSVDLDNVIVGIGDEALNIGSLTAGDTYYISIGNCDVPLGLGTFSICVQWLPDTRCDYGPGPYALCGTFKADWVGANAYAFHFTSQTTLVQYNKTQPSPTPGTFCVLNTVPGLAWNDTYDVVIGAVWNLMDGAGNMEAVEVEGDEPCFIIVNPQPLMVLRPSDNCANHGPHFIGNTIAGQPFVCGSVDYQWEFTRTDVPELPIVHNRGAANRFLNLNTVPGLTPGGTYDVRVRPIFLSAPSSFGAVDCLSIIGPAGMVADNNGATVEHAISDKIEGDGLNVGLYPNPNNGELINVNLTNLESDIVKIEMFDMFGKLVYSKQFAVEGVLNTILTFDQPLAGGVYMVNITMNGEIQTERMVVER